MTSELHASALAPSGLIAKSALGGRTTVRADVCIIGSGAGGAPAAHRLAAAGLDVVILEEGEWHAPPSFTGHPRDMTTALYRDAGQTITVGTPALVVPVGKAVGGTTLINMGTCFRTPEHVLRRWRDEHGLTSFTAERMDPIFAGLEAELGVSPVPAELAGANARIVRTGAEALGVSGGPLARNAIGCEGRGVCAFGCPTGAKQHTGSTFVSSALASGATIYTGIRARRLLVCGRRVEGVLATTADGRRLKVVCPTVIVACGALLTPWLIRHVMPTRGSGELGRNLTLHPASAARALMDDVVDPWVGVPQSYYVDHLAEDGIILEGIAGPPDQQAMSTPGFGVEHRDRMLNVRRTASFGVMISDDSTGTIRHVLGRPVIRYDLTAADAERFRRGFALLAEIFFAAGAREVVVPVAGVPALRDGDVSPLLSAAFAPGDISAMAFHPLGTARMGADPSTAVVDENLRIHGLEGAYVCDGSVVPTSLGVNPQITIMALSVRLAEHLLKGSVAT